MEAIHYALYMQWGSGLKLRSEISQKEILPKPEQKNFVILSSEKKFLFEDFLPRNKELIKRMGFKIIRNDISDSLWHK